MCVCVCVCACDVCVVCYVILHVSVCMCVYVCGDCVRVPAVQEGMCRGQWEAFSVLSFCGAAVGGVEYGLVVVDCVGGVWYEADGGYVCVVCVWCVLVVL